MPFLEKDSLPQMHLHELRTPLSIIKGTLEVLIRKPREVSQYEEKISYCISETDRMTKLIDQLLLLARYDTGKISPVKTGFLFSEKIEIVLDRLNPLLEDKRLTVKKEISGSLTLIADPGMIEIIVENILTNAIKYSGKESSIDVKAVRNESSILFSVKDYGIGMTEQEIKNIFDRFYRADESRSSEAGGFGLGLAISKKLCDIQDIKINVESTPGQGTIFTLHLPV